MRAVNAMPEKVLIPVDGSDGSLAAVAEVLRRSRSGAPPEVHLLNVQPEIFTAEILAHLPPQAGEAYYARLGGQALRRARALLEEAGIACEVHRLVGPVVQTILDQRESLQCDSIVMGTHGHGLLTGALLGSVATGVVHHSPVPVTLVKSPARRSAAA